MPPPAPPVGGAFGFRRLPDFPWDRLAADGERARAHPDGIVDLSVGTPVDPTPEVVQRALAAAADSPGLPHDGRPRRHSGRRASTGWPGGFGVTGLDVDGVLPVIGSKELIASLPAHLGLGPGDLVVHPALAYPTYEVGARLAGARAVATDSLTAARARSGSALVWLNSPSNPTGRVLPVDHLRKVVGVVPRARRAAGLRRVLPRVRLGRASRSPCCTPTSAAATTPASSRCTRCPSAPTSPATAARSSPATRAWSPSCSRSARTSG